MRYCVNSFALDYVARQKLGGTSLTYFVLKQLPILPPAAYDRPALWMPPERQKEWLLPRVLELTYTAWDLEPFAQDILASSEWRIANSKETEGFSAYWRLYSPRSPLTTHHSPPPFRWNEERRFLLRCELDAAYFHLYGITRDAVVYIMETFPIVKRKDEAQSGEYRTKRVILEIFDAMQRAIDTGEPYCTLLDPPPADPRVAHPPKTEA